MVRMSLLAMWMATGAVLGGCQRMDWRTTELPYDQRLVVVLHETTSENPAQATVKLDGKTVFGPGDLTPGATREVVLHDPAAESSRKLNPGTTHQISWKLHRNGMMNRVGSVDLMVYSGTKMIKGDSTKYVMPTFWTQGGLDVKLTPAGSGPVRRSTPPPGLPKP